MHSQTVSSICIKFIMMMLSASLRTQSGRHVATAFKAASPRPLSWRQASLFTDNIICYMSSTNGSYDYNSLKVSELRDLLKENGLPITGIKAELVDRLNGANIKNEVPPNLQFVTQTDDSEDWDDEIIVEDDEEANEDFDPNQTAMSVPKEKARGSKKSREASKSKWVAAEDNFRSTRVFVQGIPKDATWQELKDHFQIAGSVAYASISVDRRTGESKQCGIVQFETPDSAAKAIREMRNNPMNGATLYVREDVQESRSGRSDGWDRPQRARRNENDYKINMPSEWRRANDADDGKSLQYDLEPAELKKIEMLVQQRDAERRKKNWHVSDAMRDQLKEQYGVHLDDNLKMWWTDINGQVPGVISDIKGDGRWGKQQPWRQIPTTPEYDAQVDSDRVMALLNKRDKARKMKDFDTADSLLQLVYETPENGLGLRIHDQSRTWRVWTDLPPPKKSQDGLKEMTVEEMCLKIVEDNDPDKVHEIKSLLKKFPGREWNIYKKLKERYGS
ncbi:hypothetical protein ACHAWO_005088 [Cyclotella atomus]|uniref:Uncharacterized protein n=1 Tax=Cyclotella atomus TaxID=382360 RepID=A0ABD3PBA8_9STRA